jgi:hypothetical protein
MRHTETVLAYRLVPRRSPSQTWSNPGQNQNSNRNSNSRFLLQLVKSTENKPLGHVLQILYPWNPYKI